MRGFCVRRSSPPRVNFATPAPRHSAARQSRPSSGTPRVCANGRGRPYGPLERDLQAAPALQRFDRSGKIWNEFKILKDERNRLAHPTSPIVTFQLSAAARTLNLVRLGVGQLLIDAERAENRWPSPSLWAVRHAPAAKYTGTIS